MVDDNKPEGVDRYVFVFRHGQRKDHVLEEYPEFKHHPDSPLTPLGYQQAREVGQRLKKEIELIAERHGVQPVVTFESSPFLRCIETATQVGKELGLNECTLNYFFGEWLADWIFKENPAAELTSQTRPMEEINKDFEEYGVTFKDEDPEQRAILHSIQFPEPKERCAERFSNGVKKIGA